MPKLTPLVLSRTTSISTTVVDENRLQQGLNLKFGAKKLKLWGHSHPGENEEGFSHKAIYLVKSYVTFPNSFSSSKGF